VDRVAAVATERLQRCAGAALTRSGGRLERDVGRVESATLARLASHERRLTDARRRVRLSGPRALDTAARRTDLLAARVDAVDPVRAMRRGWTVTATADGRLVRRAADLAAGTTIVTTFADGTATSRVESVDPAPDPETRHGA
jgi:exodeoxyribonuclease VII large subunit